MLKAAKSFVCHTFGDFEILPIWGAVRWYNGRLYPSPDKVPGVKRPDLLIRFSNGSTAFIEAETGHIHNWTNGENFKKLTTFCETYAKATRNMPLTKGAKLGKHVILIGNAEKFPLVFNSLPSGRYKFLPEEALREIGKQHGFSVDWLWYKEGECYHSLQEAEGKQRGWANISFVEKEEGNWSL